MSDNQVRKHFDKPAMVFLILPLAFFVLSMLCFIGGCILEQPTSRGGLYSLLMICAIALLWLDIIPGAIFVVIGLVRAVRAKMTGFFVLGLIEVSGVALLLLISAYIIFVAGPGV